MNPRMSMTNIQTPFYSLKDGFILLAAHNPSACRPAVHAPPPNTLYNVTRLVSQAKRTAINPCCAL